MNKNIEEFQKYFERELPNHKFKNSAFLSAKANFEADKNINTYVDYKTYLTVIGKTK